MRNTKRMGWRITVFVGIASLLLSLANAYKQQDLTKFGYRGSLAPTRWGTLDPKFFLCRNGTRQSPINIVKRLAVHDPTLRSLDQDYHVTNASLVDFGFNVQIKYGMDVGVLRVDGANYTLKQMHWHFPSEHTIDGKRFPVELHMVHSHNDEKFAVVAVLFKFGAPDPFISKYLTVKVEELTRQIDAGNLDTQVPIGRVDLKSFRRHTNTYYRYPGSVTTPPCDETVIWSVLGKVRELSLDQMETLRAPLATDFHNNSRPTQPLNGRVVRLHQDR